MSLDSKKFSSELPEFFSLIFKDILHQGLVPILVGGSVRDFFLTGKMGYDWDLELHHETMIFSLEQWKDFGRSLLKKGKVTFLPYEVIRFEINDHQLEFSPPRKEKFDDTSSEHKNFEASFDYRMPFEQAVLRRDFTINAMGICFKNLNDFELLDPLLGLEDLRKGILHPCSSDFHKDPVRFLRALRFLRKLKFMASPELKKELRKMKVSGVSPNYLWSEMQKSGDGLGFYLDLIDESEFHPELKLPLDKSVSLKKDELARVLKDTSSHECWMIALEWVGISCGPWQNYFSLSPEFTKKFSRWAFESRLFKNISPEVFRGDFERIRLIPEFDSVFNWFITTKKLLQKKPNLPLLTIIEDFLPSWISLYRFEVLNDVKHIDPPLRARYQVWDLCQRL